MFKNNEWKNPYCFNKGELPYRAYFVPFSSEKELGQKREDSPYFFLLNGQWKFRFKESISQTDSFYETGFDISGFDTIPVPSCWQMYGFDYIQYQSSPYPFIFDPPNVPSLNPAGEYIKEFDFNPKSDKKYELHFEGKDSCVFVWLNGSFIGYGEAPHNDSAFDITNLLINGCNRLCVLVSKWCSGSYLDDQDKIRLSGIFRDVYILERSKDSISNFCVNTYIDGRIEADIKSASPVSVTLKDADGAVVCSKTVSNGKFSADIENPRLWSAETPYLYSLILHCKDEYILHKFGIREVAVINNTFTVNRMPVKIYGVNRHDSDPRRGYTVSREHIKRDLVMMKQHNINAIRTAHYPNVPYFYELCDELGFYVISEADMECHGAIYMHEIHRIVDNPEFHDAICDRLRRMIESLRNFTSIIIWSLGNESSWGENIKDEAHLAKKLDGSRLIHYEAVSMKQKNYEFANDPEVRQYLDIYGRMYIPVETLKTFYDNPKNTKPLLMCEYSHAMGNSCGDLKLYDDLFESNPKFMGGCIWEWCDHAVCLKNKDGCEFYGYGGDFGDSHNLGNVCMDGLVNPDRIPHSSLLEAKAVFAPIKFQLLDAQTAKIEVYNRSGFTSLSEYRFFAELQINGEICEKKEFELSTPPLKSETVKLDVNLKTKTGYRLLSVYAVTRQNTAWCGKGHETAKAQFELPSILEPEPKIKCNPIVCSEFPDKISISGEHFSYTFSKDIGAITSVKINGKEMLNKPQVLNCWRAPTDNDNTFIRVYNMKNQWTYTTEFGTIEYCQHIMKDISLKRFEDGISICGSLIFAPQGRTHIVRGTLEYRFFDDGTVDIIQEGKFSEKLPYWLPRYGYIWSINEEFNNIKYFGPGPRECYADKHNHAVTGLYNYIIDDPAEQYEVPQECGSHTGTKWLTISDGSGDGLKFSGNFSFCASRYDIHKVTAAKHLYELEKSNSVFLYTDYFMSGVGSKSVGGQYPGTNERINPGDEINFRLSIKPVFSRKN